jgi:hypothetical protein
MNRGCPETLRLVAVSALFGFFDEFLHELGEQQRTFPGLDEAAGNLGRGDIGNVVVLGDDGNVLVGEVAVIQAVAYR